MPSTTITDVRLWDGLDPAASWDVVLDGGLIVAVDPNGAAPEDPHGERVDGCGRTLLPGLIDTHVHLLDRDELAAAAQAGVTTVVELGSHPDDLIQRMRTERGVASLLSAGSAASAPGSAQIAAMGFPARSGVIGPEDAERYLAWRAAAGADLIKIIIEDPAATEVPALSPDTLAALVAGAHARGLLTVAHVVTAAAFERGLDARVDVLTHAPLDRPLPERTVARMAEAGTVASPTLVMMRTMARARLGSRADDAFAASRESVRRMHAAGVPIIAGTDANNTAIAPVAHGSSLHDELDLLVDAGLTTAQALAAATSTAATALRRSDRGAVLVGRRADLLLVEDNPLEHLATARHPSAVWVGGELIV